LKAGTYCVTITDSQGCTGTGCTTVHEPGQIIITGVCEHNQCAGQCNGELYITVIGGTAPYTFKWDNGEDNDTIEDLCAGIYNRYSYRSETDVQSLVHLFIHENAPITQ